mmetsp:Transcript_65005/g.89327  ORF Transcript_65005/g.89327 Transcript_65005/m.89327 type:complete len:272 (+) Transcript_65005:291-1106(+)
MYHHNDSAYWVSHKAFTPFETLLVVVNFRRPRNSYITFHSSTMIFTTSVVLRATRSVMTGKRPVKNLDSATVLLTGPLLLLWYSRLRPVSFRTKRAVTFIGASTLIIAPRNPLFHWCSASDLFCSSLRDKTIIMVCLASCPAWRRPPMVCLAPPRLELLRLSRRPKRSWPATIQRTLCSPVTMQTVANRGKITPQRMTKPVKSFTPLRISDRDTGTVGRAAHTRSRGGREFPVRFPPQRASANCGMIRDVSDLDEMKGSSSSSESQPTTWR